METLRLQQDAGRQVQTADANDERRVRIGKELSKKAVNGLWSIVSEQ
jgi:hypothetical protein